MIILMLEELSEEYNSRKQHILNSKDVASDNMLQILSLKEVRIQTDHMTKLKSDVVIIIQGQQYKQEAQGVRKCYDCNKTGHITKFCPN